MAEAPLISVIIPARNAAATLAETLDSLRRQTEPDWEAFIIDDSSTDATPEIIAAYIARDARFSLIPGPGQGASSARNLGIAAATGKYLHFLDADDWTDPAFFQKMLAALAANPGAVAAFCSYRRVMPGGVITEPYRLPDDPLDPFDDFARGCLVAIHALLIEREIVQRVGGFDTELINCEDWDLWQRVTRFGGQWVPVPEGLAYYRTDGPSLSRNVDWLLHHSRIIIRRGFGQDPRLAGMNPKYASGASLSRGSIEQALAYNAIWTLGMDCGAGGPGTVDPGMLIPFTEAAMEAHAIANVIFEGLMVGSRSLPHQLAERWPAYGEKLTALIAWLGELWNNPSAARAIQYHLEERILYSEPFSTPRRFALTQSVLIDPADPKPTPLPPGIDRFFAAIAPEQKFARNVTVAALGDFTPGQWLAARGIGHAPGIRGWRRVQGRAGDITLAARLTKHLLRHPGTFRRRSLLKSALKEAWTEAFTTQLGPLAPPGSHAAKFRQIQAWAADYATAHANAEAQKPASHHQEDGVNHADRQGHFEQLFATVDPWNYNSPYEQQKYQRQLDILPPGPIRNALELACAEGHLTCMLAPRVENLLATDIAPTALTRTQSRCAAFQNIEYQTLDFSKSPIPGNQDLIICSEVLYYLSGEAELREIAPRIAAALSPGGSLVTAHAYVLKDNLTRTGFDWDTVYGAETILRVFSALPELQLEHSIETELYRIDRFRRTSTPTPLLIETLPVTEQLDPDVGRHIVWGRAAIRRDTASHTERRSSLPILMYHGVSEDGPAGLARYRVTPEMFRAQLRWLRANGFHSIGAEQLAAQFQSGQPFHGRPIMLTFDDGFQDFADNAWPLLTAHDFTAEMFVVTDRVGGHAIWDEKLGPPTKLMDAPTIARLAAEGALFGSHLATHRPVDGLTSIELAEELASSHAMLSHWLGRPPLSFAAPFTITDSRLGCLAAQAGYGIGFGGGTGPASLAMDPLNLPRIEVRGEWPLQTFITTLESTL